MAHKQVTSHNEDYVKLKTGNGVEDKKYIFIKKNELICFL
jgi:hypothetical protein